MRKRRMRIAALLLSVVTAVTSFTIPSKPVTVEAAVSQSEPQKRQLRPALSTRTAERIFVMNPFTLS